MELPALVEGRAGAEDRRHDDRAISTCYSCWAAVDGTPGCSAGSRGLKPLDDNTDWRADLARQETSIELSSLIPANGALLKLLQTQLGPSFLPSQWAVRSLPADGRATVGLQQASVGLPPVPHST